MIGFCHLGNEENHGKRVKVLFILKMTSLELMKEHDIFTQFRKKIRKHIFQTKGYKHQRKVYQGSGLIDFICNKF